MTLVAVPSDRHHITLDDTKQRVALPTTVYACPTRAISLENPPIHMHPDGINCREVSGAVARKLTHVMRKLWRRCREGLGISTRTFKVGDCDFQFKSRLE